MYSQGAKTNVLEAPKNSEWPVPVVEFGTSREVDRGLFTEPWSLCSTTSNKKVSK